MAIQLGKLLMDEEQKTPATPPKAGGSGGEKALWFCVGMIPSLMGIAIMAIGLNSSASKVAILISIGLILAASIGMTRTTQGKVRRAFLMVFLAGFFFMINGIVVVFVGCSSMGRIAP
jgi:hypothetical protein